MLKSLTLEVVGEQKLHCEGCANRVMRLLTSLQGVERARAQASNQRIEVQFDPALLDSNSIAERLRDAGYDTRPVPVTQTQPT